MVTDLKKNSINRKIFLYLFGFVLFIIMLLFILQTLALESFYKSIKKREVSKNAEYIIQNFDNTKEYDIELEEYLNKLFIYNNIYVAIYDEEGTPLIKNFHKSYRMDKLENAIDILYSKTSNFESKSQFFIFNRQKDTNSEQSFLEQSLNHFPGSKRESDFLIFCKVSEEKRIIVVIETVLSPVGATKNILQIQILYVSIVLILSATLLAYVLSKKISAPIIKINDSAKKLAQGDYNLILDKKDYKEVQELNETIIQTAIELKKADKMQKDLIANISHDLRTPLTMIIGYAEVMRDIPNENNRENIQIIIDEASRLNQLVNDILFISKAQNDSLQIENENITLLIKEIIERVKKMTEKDNYNFIFMYDEEIVFPFDKMKISQVVYNLIGNAITHTGADKKIFIEQIKIDAKVKIIVSDTGKGIAKEELKNIWERYYKIDDFHNRDTVGTGLGLSIVKNIIKLHNGRVGVESSLGNGSSFYFELPL